MSDASLVESGGLRQPCADCRRFEATLLAPAGDSGPERFICEACADAGDLWRDCQAFAPERETRPFVLVDLPFLDLVAPLLGAVELRTYFGVARLTDGHRKAYSAAAIARAAVAAPRNVADALRILKAAGLVVLFPRRGPKPPRYMVVRPQSTHRDAAIPALIRPDVYEEAAAALPGIRGSELAKRRNAKAVIPGSEVIGSGDPVTTDPQIRSSRTLCPDQIRSNHLRSGGKPAQPTPERGKAAPAACSIAEQAAETAAGKWEGYALTCLVEQARRLLAWSGGTERPATRRELTGYLLEGAGTDWLQRAAQRPGPNRVGSPLHVWCQRKRWIEWLDKKRTATRLEAQRERAAKVRELPVAERIAAAAKGLADFEALCKAQAG